MKSLFRKKAERDQLFEKARSRLIAECLREGGLRSAKKMLWPLIGPDTVDHLVNKQSHNFDHSTKDRLVWYYGNGPTRFLYRIISQRIGQHRYVKRSLADDFSGSYVYFRYYAGTNDPEKLTYIRGRIRIFRQDDVPCFEHFSHNHKGSDPEHSGFVFYDGNHLFMLGTRPGVIRLAVAQATKQKEVMNGLVLSQRSRPPHDPFSARFLMVREEEALVVNALADSTPGKGKFTVGEEKFFELTDGGYAYFMLSLHHRED